MSYSKLITTVVPKKRSHFTDISWRTWAILSVPVIIVGVAGSYYLIKHRKKDGCTKLTVARKNKGNQYFKAGQYKRAMELYEEGLDNCPLEEIETRAALYQNRAAAKEHLKMYESAVNDCDLALELQPKYKKALNRRAHLYEKLDKLDECLIDVVACCILESFTVGSTINFMGQVLKTLGDRKAEKEIANLSPSLPSAVFVRNYLSAYAWDPFAKGCEENGLQKEEDLVNGGEVNGTSGSLETSQDSGLSNELTGKPAPPTPSPFHAARETLNQAMACMPRGEYEKSMELAEKAVELFEQALKLTNGRWTSADDSAVATSGDQQAEVTVEEVLDDVDEEAGERRPAVVGQQGPDDHRLEYNRARLLYATYLSLVGQSKKAIDLLQQVGEKESGADTLMRVNALVKLASMAMSANEDIEGCLGTFQKAQEFCPSCPDIYLHRGQISLLAGRLDEALEDFDTAVKLKPDFSINQAERLFAQYRQALLQSDMSRASSRVEQFRRLAKKYPDCLETQSLFAQVLSDRGDFEQCDEVYGKVIELAPCSGPTYAQRGILHLRWRQDREAAGKWFTRGAEVDPKCELIQELLGQLALETGDLDKALTHFNRAIEQAKTRHDLAHLIALRDSVLAQQTVCAKYNIPIQEVLAAVKRDQMLAFGQ